MTVSFRSHPYFSIFLIFLVAISLRTSLFLAVEPWDDQIAYERIISFDDAPGYHETAIHIVKGIPEIAAYSSALYQYLIAALYAIFGSKPYIVILFQIFINSLSCVFLYKIARTVFSENISLLAGLLLAVEYSNILYTQHLLSETTFVFMFILHIYFLANYLAKKDIKDLIYAAIFLGLSTHTRSIGLYFIFFLLWPLYAHFKSNIRQGTISLLMLATVFMLVITPWMFRNYAVAGLFALSTDQGKAKYWYFPNTMNILDPLSKKKERRWTEQEKRQIIEEVQRPGIFSIANVVKKYDINPVQLSRWQKQIEQGSLSSDLPDDDLKKKKLTFQGYFGTKVQDPNIPRNKQLVNAAVADAKSIASGIVRFLFVLNSGGYLEILGIPANRVEHNDWEKGLVQMTKDIVQKKSTIELSLMVIGIGILGYLYLTALFGIYMSIKKKEFRKIILFVTVILYFVLASAGTNATEVVNPRHKVPIMPYWILLSCYGTSQLLCRLQPLRRSKDITV